MHHPNRRAARLRPPCAGIAPVSIRGLNLNLNANTNDRQGGLTTRAYAIGLQAIEQVEILKGTCAPRAVRSNLQVDL